MLFVIIALSIPLDYWFCVLYFALSLVTQTYMIFETKIDILRMVLNYVHINSEKWCRWTRNS